MTVRVVHNSVTGAAANPAVLVDGPKWDADHTVTGLENVDNTSDVNKPVSTATQTALNLKAPLASPALTGNPTAPTPSAGDNDTSIATTAFVVAAIRERLLANRTYYVRKDGSDANNGQADTAGGAFLTIQKAVNTVSTAIDLNGFIATIQVRTGTYSENVSFYNTLVGAKDTGVSAILTGDTTTPSNVVISGSGSVATLAAFGNVTQWAVSGFKLLSATNINLNAHGDAWLRVGKIEFGTAGAGYLGVADYHGVIELQDNCTISAVAPNTAFFASDGSYVLAKSGITITLTGTPAFSGSFVNASGGSAQNWTGVIFSGSATGLRYGASTGGLLVTGGAGATFFPGNSSGALATGGRYDDIVALGTVAAGSTIFSPTIDTINLTGGQIAFPAAQSASAGANTLDDYEEGTFTPVLTFATPGDLSVTYSQQAGSYEKIGKFVFCQFTIITSAFTFTTASGNLTITGLPFTSGATANGRAPLVWGGVTKAGFTSLVATVSTSNTTMVINASGSGVAAGVVTAADTPTGGTVVMAGTASYLASA